MYEVLKRITDILAALFVIALFSPLLILICIAIPLDSPGPIIYKQRRVGKNGKIFFIWKFRSMFDKADEHFVKDKEFMKNFKKKEGWKFKNASEDPRITRVGRFIRKYSFDELPNLWNILVGDMSIVGPRAYRNDDIFGDEMSQQLKFYPGLEKDLEVAMSVKPGLTGPWQTSGRNKLAWDKRVKLDAAYAKKKDIIDDFLIVLKTPFAMFNKW
jgi:exopolysaccharide production protein ExoY